MNTLKDSTRSKNAADESNVVSRFFQWYLNQLFYDGNKRQLQSEDVYQLSEKNQAEYVGDKLLRIWNKEKEKSLAKEKSPSFFKSVISFIYIRWIILVLGFAVVEVCKISNTIFLKNALDSLSKDDKNERTSAYYWASALAGSSILLWLFNHEAFLQSEFLGVNVKSSVLTLVYNKVLQVSQVKLGEITTGHIVTMFSSDAQKLQQGLLLTPFLIIGPLSAIAGVAILWKEVGRSCLAGVAVILLLLPLQLFSGKQFAKLRAKSLKLTDRRINKMNEIISSMKVTKMFAWEESFSEQVKEARKNECRQILKAATLKALNSALFNFAPYLMVFATFVTYYYDDGEITVGKVYFAVAIFASMKVAVMIFVPLSVQMGMEFRISCKRIEKFLLQPTMTSIDITQNEKKEKISIEFNNVVATWEGETPVPVLNDISFKADQKNNLVIIYGAVGTGKTSVLMAALQEMKIKSGNAKIEGKVAYAAQQPWIFSGTIQQNILFGQEYDEEKFNKIVEACALIPDLDSFKKREYTLVGERGVSLSGGQKARIGLARAIYSDADIYLLDDPLSAVDTKVGKYIFQKCIKGLLKDKVVILVTHQTQYLEAATQKISFKCCEKLLLPEEDDDIYVSANENDDDSAIDLNEDGSSLSSEEPKKEKEKRDDGGEKDEFRKHGRVSFKVYVSYFVKGVGTVSTLMLYAVLICCQISFTVTDYWIGEWAQSEDKLRSNKSFSTRLVFESNRDRNIYLYIGLIGIVMILSFVSSGYLFAVMIRCSRELHNRMFAIVLKAPMYFFDTNPVGQVLNRFSGDIHQMDDMLPYVFNDFSKLSITTMAIIIINCISVPYLTILVVIMLVAFVYFRNYYLSTARDIKRIESCDRSPMFTHVSATLAGIVTIRAFNLHKKIYDEFIKCLDYQTESSILFKRCARWFAQRLDFGVIIFSIICIFVPIILATYSDDIDPGLICVTFTYLLQLCGMFQYCVRQSAEVDNLMTSVERVREYTKLEIEEDIPSAKTLPEGWVKDGRIESKDSSYAYHRTLPKVLNNINFNINPMEKIGIVGRTGAGKSTLISMLFRLGKNEGLIEIDGHDISQLSMKTLRKAISVIPQDPILFTGTLRRNLDPFFEHTDEAIWNALEEVEMKTAVQNFSNKLDTEIVESGGNLSVGEKQLLCLARALLKKNKILLVDEATANVDKETDSLIQKTVRSTFKECTVLTIAHRLNTIMDSDRIMVVHDGSLVEFDTPQNLLSIENGFFRKLVEETGEKESKYLKTLIQDGNRQDNYFI